MNERVGMNDLSALIAKRLEIDKNWVVSLNLWMRERGVYTITYEFIVTDKWFEEQSQKERAESDKP